MTLRSWLRRRPALGLEHLEDRTVPANLSITDFTLLDVNGNPTAALPTVGTLAAARVSWSASGMSSLDEFEVKFTFNGGTITEGPIFSFVGNSFYQGTTDIENWLVKSGIAQGGADPAQRASWTPRPPTTWRPSGRP